MCATEPVEPVFTVNGRSYRCLRRLVKGKGGYSYLVEDGAGQYTLKQIHHEPCAYYQFGEKLASELRDYERLRALGIPMPALLDVDREGERILKTYIEGPTVLELVLADKLEPEHWQQIYKMARILADAGLNIDYFPTNFVVQSGVLYYVDFECNGYMEQWSFDAWGRKYWARTPELQAYLDGRNN